MSEYRPARLIVDRPQNGFWNMAVDEALMQTVGESPDSLPVVRFYQWSEPTLSLGYFQQVADRISHSASLDCPLVRRNSGGGAILHDAELTYSVTLPEQRRHSKDSAGLYENVHQVLAAELESWGAQATLNERLEKKLEKNFLCFQRRAPRDLLLSGHKIGGSAQRKKHQALSQHGSLILKTSSFAPEITGTIDITGQPIDVEELVSGLARRLSEALHLELQAGDLSSREKILAAEIEKVKFSTLNWNRRR